MQRKVFRIWKWMQSLGYGEDAIKIMEAAIKTGWPQQCEGKTKEECMKSGLTIVVSSWLVEEE